MTWDFASLGLCHVVHPRVKSMKLKEGPRMHAIRAHAALAARFRLGAWRLHGARAPHAAVLQAHDARHTHRQH